MSLPAAVRVLPHDMTQPSSAPLPLLRASRWNSPHDAASLQPMVKVFVTQPAYGRIAVHSASDTRNEVGGILVGQWCQDEKLEQFIVVEHALPARHTRQGSAHLTVTQDSLVDIPEQIDAKYEGQLIVGWYHTHPSMGVFLSHYDTWLHRHFFPEPWQVALVVEPVSATGGFFVRQKQGLLDPTRYFGFYELDGSHGRSMVYWTNMNQVEDRKETYQDE